MHRGHDHHHPSHADGGSGGIGHNGVRPPAALQWQRAHAPQPAAVPPEGPQEPDLDLVETVFADGFAATRDPTSFLRLAQVPFEAVAPDGTRLVLLRVEAEAVSDVGAVSPYLGGSAFRYDPLPAAMVSRRRKLRFVYFDGSAPRALTLGEVRGLTPA